MLALIAVLVGACASPTVIADDQTVGPLDRVTHPVALAERVRFSLKTDESDYLVRQPVQFELRLENVSAEPVRGFFKLYPTARRVEIQYRRHGQFRTWRVEFDRYIETGFVVHGPVVLEPGASVSERVTVAIQPDTLEFVLDQPGEYEFRAIYRDIPNEANAVVASDPVTVRAASAPPSAVPAMERFDAEIAVLAQYRPHCTRKPIAPEVAARFEALAHDHPDSEYVKGARAGLVWYLREKQGRRQTSRREEQLLRTLMKEDQLLRLSKEAPADEAPE